MHITYEPKGICARKVEFDIEDGVVKNISFLYFPRGYVIKNSTAAVSTMVAPAEVSP